jgi:cardiolipin synthase
MSSILSVIRCGVLALAASLAACAVPDVDRSIAESAAESKPVIQGADGRLSPAASDALIVRLGGAEGGEILQRHLKVEEAVAGSPLTTDNAVEVLRDGDQTFAAIGKAISDARETLNLEYYTIEDVDLKTSDGNARQLADMLVAKLQQGVAVNIIYDSYGSHDTPAAFFDRLEKAGAKLVDFHPIDPNPANIIDGNDRDHRKILVADGRIAVIGGVNLSKSYESKSPGSDDDEEDQDPQTGLPALWRDTSIRIEGPAVAEIQKLFFTHWKEEGGAAIDTAPYFPKPAAKGDAVVRVIGSSPKQEISRYYVTLISALRSAETKIWISNAYFVPTPEEMEALIAAAERGVDVRLMLADESDSPPAVEAARSHYSDLLEAGVKIYETSNVVLHSKTVVIDGVWSAVGSSNLDHRSVLFNDEIDAVVIGKKTAEDLEAIFNESAQTALAIDQARWEAQRPFSERIRGFFARLYEGLL